MTSTVTLLATALLLLGAPLTAEAQSAGKIATAAQRQEKAFRVGYLTAGSQSDQGRRRRFEAFRQALRDLGHVDGQTIAFEFRWAEGQYDQLPTLAAGLVRSKVDVIVAVGGAAARAAQQATGTIPIVMVAVNDPLGSGLVPSLSHPGGNVTGTSLMAPDLVGKQFQVLKETVPKVSRVALLRNPANPASEHQLREAETAARALGMRLQSLEARGPEDINRAFAAMTKERASALVVLTDSIFTNQRRQIAELAVERRLPAVYGHIEHAEAGGLLAFSANLLDVERRAAIYVDRILKGAKPGDLPVEQPTKIELIVNLRAAKAIGLTVPPSVLQRADHVID